MSNDILKNKYYIKHRKNGFHIIWNLDDETIDLINRKLQINNLKFVCCHMKIWNKAFYEKHKKDKENKYYNEAIVLNNLNKKIQSILKKENFEIIRDSKNPDKKKKIILRDIFNYKSKNFEGISRIIQYDIIFAHNMYDDKFYLVTLFRRK